jgi:3-methyl-2-oxobutanoate hydroxymethyltransferase
MSLGYLQSKEKPVCIPTLLKRKENGHKISMVTCYDSAFGHLVEKSSIDVVLVGDSLGNVMLGFDSTIPVTIEDMVHHCAAVTRSVKRPFVVGDLPFMTYATCENALKNSALLMQKGGVQAVKIEGGEQVCPQVSALVGAGIPVMGHLGLTPQSVHALGGYKVQGTTDQAADEMIRNAKALETAGAFAVVLEMVPRSLAKKITKALKIPTIGIGAGSDCDGQVLVLHDLLGFDSEFSPKFLKKYAALGDVILKSLSEYDKDVKSGVFPDSEHSFGG